MKKDKPIKLCVCLPCILNYRRVAAAPTVFFLLSFFLHFLLILFLISAALVVHTHPNVTFFGKSCQNCTIVHV